MKRALILISTSFFTTSCTQIVTAPIKVASTAVSSTLDVAGAAGGAIVNTIRGGSCSED